MRGRRRCAAILGVVLAWSGYACATETQVELLLEGCRNLSESALREHLGLELSTLGLSAERARLSLRCVQTSVEVSLVRATGERYPIEARVELRDTAKGARERLVALAASELMAQAERAHGETDQTVRPAAAPQTGPKIGAPRASSARESPDARGRVELFIAGDVASGGEPRVRLWGGSLGTRWQPDRSWWVSLSTRLERGQEDLRLAKVLWTSLSGIAGAGAELRAGPLRLSAGLGARAGWLALSAAAAGPNEGRSLTAPWVGLALPLRAALDTGGVVLPFVAVEPGYVVLPVRGKVDDGDVLVAQRGLSLTASVGVALVL